MTCVLGTDFPLPWWVPTATCRCVHVGTQQTRRSGLGLRLGPTSTLLLSSAICLECPPSHRLLLSPPHTCPEPPLRTRVVLVLGRLVWGVWTMVLALTSFMPLSKSSSVSTGSLMYKIGQVIFLLQNKQGNLCKLLNTGNVKSTLHGFACRSENYVQSSEQRLACSKPSVGCVPVIAIITIISLSLILLVLNFWPIIH